MRHYPSIRRQNAWLALLVLPVVVVLLSVACVKARHIAVVADEAFAAAVFALDDAEFGAWQAKALSDEQHARLNPIIKKALGDVKAITLIIQASGGLTEIPQTLPDLLTSLTNVQTILATLPKTNATENLIFKAQEAVNLAVALLSRVTGGA